MNYNIGRVDMSTSHVEITFPMVADMFARSENIQHLFQYPIVSSHLGIFHGLRTYALRFFSSSIQSPIDIFVENFNPKKAHWICFPRPTNKPGLAPRKAVWPHRPLGCRHRHRQLAPHLCLPCHAGLPCLSGFLCSCWPMGACATTLAEPFYRSRLALLAALIWQNQ